jgi:hypothetical protein
MISGKNTGSSFLGNVWWSINGKVSEFGEYASFTDWVNATGQETRKGAVTGIWSDPLLNGPFTTDITDPYKLGGLTGYMLKPESILRSVRTEINTFQGYDPPQHDFYNNPLPADDTLIPGIHEAK